MAMAHPSGDKRFAELDVTMKRHQHRPDALIEVLHKAQELFGCLEFDVLFYVARALRQPPSRIYGVATFYHLFTLKPQGKHSCIVCNGTACFVNGADAILAAVENQTRIKNGETTGDGKLTLLTARCIGPCGIAPAVVIDGDTAGKQTAESVLARIKDWLPDESK